MRCKVQIVEIIMELPYFHDENKQASGKQTETFRTPNVHNTIN